MLHPGAGRVAHMPSSVNKPPPLGLLWFLIFVGLSAAVVCLVLGYYLDGLLFIAGMAAFGVALIRYRGRRADESRRDGGLG